MNDDLLEVSMDDILNGIAIRPDMLRDLLAISNVSAQSTKKIAESIQSLKGLNTESTILKLIKSGLAESEIDAATSMMSALSNLEPKDVATILTTLEKWVKRNQQRRTLFTPDAVEKLRFNLNTIITDAPAIALIRKSDQLVRDTGGELESLKFVCDLRPVFNKSRSNVDAFVLLATLRLRYLSQSGTRESCEIAMTEDELMQLRKQTEEALSKIDVLKRVGASLNNPKSAEERGKVNYEQDL